MGLLNMHEISVTVAQARAAGAKLLGPDPREVRGDARRHDARVESDAGEASVGALAVFDPAAPGLPTTIVLRGAIDVMTAPVLGATVTTAAGTGELTVDVHRVDRFDSATWVAFAGSCSRATEAGATVRVVGLRWSQVLDVLAATPVVELAAAMAGIRALQSPPERGAPDTALEGAAEEALGRRPPERRNERVGIGRRRASAARGAVEATTDHLPRDWTMTDPGTSRG